MSHGGEPGDTLATGNITMGPSSGPGPDSPDVSGVPHQTGRYNSSHTSSIYVLRGHPLPRRISHFPNFPLVVTWRVGHTFLESPQYYCGFHYFYILISTFNTPSSDSRNGCVRKLHQHGRWRSPTHVTSGASPDLFRLHLSCYSTS